VLKAVSDIEDFSIEERNDHYYDATKTYTLSGSLRSLLARLSRVDVLVIEDWAMAPLSESERRDFWEICEDRYQVRSTVLTSQLPVSRWHEQIGDPTLADGILDRLVHNAHRIEMRGDSMRKNRPKANS
jgi:DNA replication protein DnaC